MLVPAPQPDTSGQAPPDRSRPHPTSQLLDRSPLMIILGLILLIIGFIAKIAIIWTIGIIVLVIGLVFVLLGAIGRGVGGRRHYW
jgi:Family of unknown function (DUF6131)